MTDLHDLIRMVDVLPRQLGHVDETIHATEVDERTEVDDRRHDALAHFARTQIVEELLALVFLGLFEKCTTRQHDVVAVLVELDDLGLDLAANVWLQVAHAPQFDQRCGQEAAQSDVDDEAALDDFDDHALDDAVGFFDGFDLAPRALVLRPLLGQDEASVLVFLLQDQSLDVLTELDDRIGVDVVANGQLA